MPPERKLATGTSLSRCSLTARLSRKSTPLAGFIQRPHAGRLSRRLERPVGARFLDSASQGPRSAEWLAAGGARLRRWSRFSGT